MSEHKTHQLTVLVEPSLREAIDKARGNLTMGRFVRLAIRDKLIAMGCPLFVDGNVDGGNS